MRAPRLERPGQVELMGHKHPGEAGHGMSIDHHLAGVVQPIGAEQYAAALPGRGDGHLGAILPVAVLHPLAEGRVEALIPVGEQASAQEVILY